MPLIRFAHGAEEIDRLDFECVFVREDVGRAAYFGLDGLRSGWTGCRRGTATTLESKM